MNRYIAFLRGINISGKNKIPMAELKIAFESLGFAAVKTYLNSGNVLFSSDESDMERCKNQVEGMIEKQFGLSIPVFVIKKETLADILQNAPDWWGTENKEIYDNLIFILPPATVSDVFATLGEPKQGTEQVQAYQEVIFWSFSRKDYRKTNWWSKTASSAITPQLTIRTANTLRKLVSFS